MRKALSMVGILFLATSLLSAAVTFTTADGGSNIVELSSSIKLNDESSLRREWKTAHDSSMPVDIVGTTGAKVEYTSGTKYSSGGYRYTASTTIKSSEDISAIEIIILVFNVWGELQAKLSSTQIQDIKGGEATTFKSIWSLSSGNKASEALSSLAYIAQVRTKSGEIYTADMEAIAVEAQKYAKELTPDTIKNFT
jgi:hypothetical protein